MRDLNFAEVQRLLSLMVETEGQEYAKIFENNRTLFFTLEINEDELSELFKTYKHQCQVERSNEKSKMLEAQQLTAQDIQVRQQWQQRDLDAQLRASQRGLIGGPASPSSTNSPYSGGLGQGLLGDKY